MRYSIILFLFLTVFLVVACTDSEALYDEDAIQVNEDRLSLDFEDETSFQAPTFSDVDAELGVEDNRYHITMSSEENEYVWSQGGDPIRDVDLQAQTETFSDYGNNLYGVMCRVNEQGGGYAFMISNDGFGGIARTDGESLSFMLDWVQSDAINTGQATNVIRALCIDDYFALYVNDTFIGDAEYTPTNERFPTTGQVGLIGGVFSEDDPASIAVAFDDVSFSEASLNE